MANGVITIDQLRKRKKPLLGQNQQSLVVPTELHDAVRIFFLSKGYGIGTSLVVVSIRIFNTYMEDVADCQCWGLLVLLLLVLVLLLLLRLLLLLVLLLQRGFYIHYETCCGKPWRQNNFGDVLCDFLVIHCLEPTCFSRRMGRGSRVEARGISTIAIVTPFSRFFFSRFFFLASFLALFFFYMGELAVLVYHLPDPQSDHFPSILLPLGPESFDAAPLLSFCSLIGGWVSSNINHFDWNVVLLNQYYHL